jgi:hypothetical protein
MQTDDVGIRAVANGTNNVVWAAGKTGIVDHDPSAAGESVATNGK